MSKYIRTRPRPFSELPVDVQAEMALHDELSDLHSLEFVPNPCYEGEFLRLDNFMRTDSKLWNGVYGMTYYSAYFIKFSKDFDICTVGYRYW